MNVGTIVAISAISALVSVTGTPDEEKLEPKRYNLSGAPEQAAACVAGNAKSAGETAFLHPLYGNERIAVVMRNGPTGDTLATVFLDSAEPGSTARIVTTPYVEDPEALVKRLLAKC